MTELNSVISLVQQISPSITKSIDTLINFKTENNKEIIDEAISNIKEINNQVDSFNISEDMKVGIKLLFTTLLSTFAENECCFTSLYEKNEECETYKGAYKKTKDNYNSLYDKYEKLSKKHNEVTEPKEEIKFDINKLMITSKKKLSADAKAKLIQNSYASQENLKRLSVKDLSKEIVADLSNVERIYIQKVGEGTTPVNMIHEKVKRNKK